MTQAEALVLLSAVRRAGDELARGLAELRRANPDDLLRWETGTVRALAAIQDELLEPLLRQHPAITPKELGGPPRES